MSEFEGLDAMDLEKDEFMENKSCSICLDVVIDHGDRSIAKLQCGHDFHLDCIGSAFNAKGAMQCPNCRKVEKGQWLFANGQRSSAADFDFDAWMSDEFYDLNYPELPFGFQWCPFRGITQLASLLEEGDSQLNSYHESVNNATYGDRPSASSNTHVCPYLALHGYPNALHAPAPSSSTDPENIVFPRHSNNLGGVQQPSHDILNSHSFTNTEPRNLNWQQPQHSQAFSFLGNNADQSASQFGPPRISRDVSSQQRLGSFVHPLPVIHGSGPHSGSHIVAPNVGEQHRSHNTHARNSSNYHMYQHSVPSSSIRNAPFPPPPPPPVRRSRPRGIALISSLSASSSSNEVGGFYGFTAVSSSANTGPHRSDPEVMAHHYDQLYGWGRAREGLSPSLPWIPLEGESQWWGPFNPNPGPQSGGGNRTENGYQRMPPGPRMPPPSYM